MKRIRISVIVLSLLLLAVFACQEEDECDIRDYAAPEISLLDPESGVVIIPWDAPPEQIRLHLKAEAGLNILAFEDPQGYGNPFHAFTGGEKDVIFSFDPGYYDGEWVYVIYDLCNQSARVSVRIEFEPPPDI